MSVHPRAFGGDGGGGSGCGGAAVNSIGSSSSDDVAPSRWFSLMLSSHHA